MPKEIEVRIRISEGEIKKNLLLIQAFLTAKHYRESNTIFAHSVGFRPIRLRRSWDESGNWETLELTLKGANETPKSKVRTREEINVHIHPGSPSQYEELMLFLEALGYVREFVYEKQVREANYFTRTGKLAKLFWVTLPLLGDFLEIEGESSRIVLGALKGFGLKQKKPENRSYAELSSQKNLIFDAPDPAGEKDNA